MNPDHYSSHPVYKGNFHSKLWTAAYLTDQLFGFSQRAKNEQGQVVSKYDNPSLTGRTFQKLHDKLAQRLIKKEDSPKYDHPFPIAEMDKNEFTPENFRAWKREVNAPLVIRGYLDDAPIRELTREDNLISNFGDVQVQCAHMNMAKTSSGAGQNINLVKTTLEEYLNSDKYKNYYLNNFHGLLNQKDFFKLCKGIKLQRIQDNVCALNQWFIKRGLHSRSALHCANGENIFLNVQGKKEWHFMHPSYTPVLQTTLSRYGVYAISETVKFTDKEDFYSMVTERFEFYKHIPVYKVILEPGDILYNPPWWWHDVRNVTSFTMGCATRWVDKGVPTKRIATNNPVLFSAQMLELIKHPTKSPYVSLWKVEETDQFLDSIFSNKWTEVKDEEKDRTPVN